MIATRCNGCGRIAVIPSTTSPSAQPSGHHAAANDPDADWICYGEPVEIVDAVESEVVLAAHAERSVFGLEDLQPTKDQLNAKRVELDDARLASRLASDEAIAAEVKGIEV